jgi:dsDNA-specific endonuclease/ATPase MutS2
MSEFNDEVNDLLYGDIGIISTNAQTQMLSKEVEELKKKCSSLETELNESRQQILALTQEKIQVEINMMSLYNTAVIEIGRKDKQIQELMLKKR